METPGARVQNAGKPRVVAISYKKPTIEGGKITKIKVILYLYVDKCFIIGPHSLLRASYVFGG